MVACGSHRDQALLIAGQTIRESVRGAEADLGDLGVGDEAPAAMLAGEAAINLGTRVATFHVKHLPHGNDETGLLN